MNLKSALSALLILICASTATARSANERIADAMNRSDWFELESIMTETPKDSIMDFLEVFARCLLGNRLNRPDLSLPAFEELLSTQSENLDLGNLVNSGMMYALDLNHTERNAEAAAVLTSILTATRPHLDAATCSSIERLISLYSGLARYKPYGIAFADSTGASIPFTVNPVGPSDKNSVLMHLDNSFINGREARICFDTGAGANIISDSLATVYGLEPVDAPANVLGVSLAEGSYAVARQLRLGNLTLTDVPFIVVNITSNNAEADRYIADFSIIVGSDLMLRLKELTIDFANRRIDIPAQAPARSGAKANMCFSPTLNLLTQADILGDRVLANIDTGDASYGSLGNEFYEQHRTYIEANGTPDSIREAGIGGVHITKTYKVPNLPLGIGGNVDVVPEMAVKTTPGTMSAGVPCNIGIKSLMLFGKVHFNMVDFIFTTMPQDAAYAKRPLATPKLTFTPAPATPLWQTLLNTAIEGTREYLTTH